MIPSKHLAAAAAVAALGLVAQPASAALTFYGDAASFGAATFDADNVNFPDIPTTLGVNPASFTQTTLNYTTTLATDDAISDGLLFIVGSFQTGHSPVLSSQGHDNGTAHLRITVDTPIRAVAIYFGTPRATNVTFAFSNGDNAVFASSDAPTLYGTPHFLGMVSDTPFTSLLITAPDTTGFNHLNVEEVVVGQAVVPEPGTWALMLLGFGGLGAALRARRRDSFMLPG